MNRINFEELSTFCAQSGYELRNWIPRLASTDRRKRFAISNDIQEIPEVLYMLVNLDSSERVVWIRDWTIWGERLQEIGLRHLDLLADVAEDGTRSSDAHAYSLHESEWREAIALLVVPVLFGWDAHLLFRSGLLLVDVSPHGDITVTAATGVAVNLDKLN